MDTRVGLFTAIDPDKDDRLYYQLDSPEVQLCPQYTFWDKKKSQRMCIEFVYIVFQSVLLEIMVFSEF